uniref:Uncharacterized protein n=1 Tax=Solanum lycopersicum TaxID=4081 RepID=A0A3Q7GT81_SOLLC
MRKEALKPFLYGFTFKERSGSWGFSSAPPYWSSFLFYGKYLQYHYLNNFFFALMCVFTNIYSVLRYSCCF